MSAVKGWCPTPWAPMRAGDGLLLRVRPRLGLLSAAQTRFVADVARSGGNGAIDLTNRANLQLRGFDESGWRTAIDRLIDAQLVDPDPAHDGQPAVLVVPDWTPGDDSHRLATDLLSRLDQFPPLPPKIGIAIDAGATTALEAVPADFRMERGENGRIILRPDGRETGMNLTEGREIDTLIDLVHWFVTSGGGETGRMRRHHAALPDWAAGRTPPASTGAFPVAGVHPFGAIIGLPFGRIDADDLAALAELQGFRGLRLTPWRMLIVEGVSPADPALPASDRNLLRIDACVGAPACPQASVQTRALALRLARHANGQLHVSGCSKGCAYTRPAETVLTGRDGRFDLARHARAGSEPTISGLTTDQILTHFENRADAL